MLQNGMRVSSVVGLMNDLSLSDPYSSCTNNNGGDHNMFLCLKWLFGYFSY